MGKHTLCRRFLLCLCCHSLKKDQPSVSPAAPNQSTLTHMDNSVSWEKTEGRTASRVKTAAVAPLPAGKSSIVTGGALKQYIATSPVNPSKLNPEPAEEPSLSSAGRYVPVSFSESSQSGRDLSTPVEGKVEFCDKNSDMASVQDMSVAGLNLQAAQREIEIEREFEADEPDFNCVVRGVNFHELLQDSVESEQPNVVR